jgi:acyl-CoA thioesterase FadM
MGDEPPRFMYTARLEVRYRKNVPVEQPLRVVGRALKSKSRTATSTGVIYGPEGEVLAEADALLVDVPQEFIQDADLEALGWRVYEE